MSKLPKHLPLRDSRARTFPTAWKESYFRRNFDKNRGGYICPGCNKAFAGPAGFRQLDADHIKPYAKGGLTVWKTLSCGANPATRRRVTKCRKPKTIWNYTTIST